MQLNATMRLNRDERDPRTYLMFHGYGNDETEMERILDAIYQGTNIDPAYLSFRAPHERPYLGGCTWYAHSHDGAQRREACREVGDALVRLVASPLFEGRKLTLMGFSQGAYLCYRLTQDHPDLFDTAVMLSPSFHDEHGPAVAGRARYILCYGTDERHIPAGDMRECEHILEATGRLTYLRYPGMGHTVCDREITDLRRLLVA
ncbi:alpha/beta hydrolase [Bifidobacterium cuniculi]|uniref:Phospholipase/carboxylesterase superfamily protein n=1 Tax=Bifidobacterium cuniculi TaxID=1688 RepID=A0A087AQA4_9BIFI|nr:hypothetical protein [Bifidobacterium cuniculi]KFI60954.1 phospholipase/carboxylesterase superfamily protein [Bifidobacterium cuniculi]